MSAVAGPESILHPGFSTTPYWWEAARPMAGLPRPAGKVDVAVIGSGFCGLSAALELAKAGTSVAVLDAGRIGEGASTRNGGMVSAGLKLPANLDKRLGSELAARIRTEAAASYLHLEKFIEANRIDCDYVRSGRFVAAYSRKAWHAQHAFADSLRALTGSNIRMVPLESQREEIGSDYYRGGMLIDHAGGLHPARLHRGLTELAVNAGATLHDDFAVTNIERRSGGFRVCSPNGHVDAQHVLVTTNAYTGSATPYFRKRLVPVASHMIATEEIPADLMRSINPKGRMFADSKRVLFYFRASPDGRRILFGGRARFTKCDEQTHARILHAAMCRIWPELARVRVTHAWQGSVCFTFDYLPHIAEHDGLIFAGGCQGNGVAMSNYLGYRAARGLLAPSAQKSAFQETSFPSRAFYTGTPWFLPFVGSYYRCRDQLERRFS